MADAEGFIEGCTEIPLVLKPRDLLVPVFDTALINSKAAVAFQYLKYNIKQSQDCKSWLFIFKNYFLGVAFGIIVGIIVFFLKIGIKYDTV